MLGLVAWLAVRRRWRLVSTKPPEIGIAQVKADDRFVLLKCRDNLRPLFHNLNMFGVWHSAGLLFLNNLLPLPDDSRDGV